MYFRDKMDRVVFNVSGTRIETTIHTLCTFGTETTLGALSLRPDVTSEPIFLDRDPKLFLHILTCMRNRKVFTSRQLGIPDEDIWNLELAYFGLYTEDTEPVQKRKRPLDIVKEIQTKKKQGSKRTSGEN